MESKSYLIEGLQNKRPIRFSSQQLRAFTQNYAHKVGSGGFNVMESLVEMTLFEVPYSRDYKNSTIIRMVIVRTSHRITRGILPARSHTYTVTVIVRTRRHMTLCGLYG